MCSCYTAFNLNFDWWMERAGYSQKKKKKKEKKLSLWESFAALTLPEGLQLEKVYFSFMIPEES